MSDRHPSLDELVASARSGDRVALARLLSVAESDPQRAPQLAELTWRAPRAFSIGLTGAPGVGKSTLTDRLIQAMLAAGPAHSGSVPIIGVLAVDPTSPFTGGAILGDRLRMQGHAGDRRVFIRSLATRGHHGGLAVAVPDAIAVLSAVGVETVLVETVGVGQIELEVASTADATVVVVTPGWGDATQAAKAGILEVADVLVVNKADRPGAAEAVRDLEQMLDLGAPRLEGWRPPVLVTTASAGEGVDALVAALDRLRDHLEGPAGAARRRVQAAALLRRHLADRHARAVALLEQGEAFERAVDLVATGQRDPHRAAHDLG